MLKRIALLGVIILLTACLSPTNATPEKDYVLNTTPPMHSVAKTRPQVLLLSMPRLDAIMNNNKMVYLNGQHQVGYFSVNRWATKPNEMFSSLLLNTLQQQSEFRAVVSVPYSGKSDLQLDVVNFSIVQDFTVHPSLLRVKMDVRLSYKKKFSVIKTHAIQATVATSLDTPEAGVVAANVALAQCLTQIVAFVNE